MNLIYLGREFYIKSGTYIGILYTEDNTRYDWSFVERDLKAGHVITIRYANESELARAREGLKIIPKKRLRNED